jgi:hypothetical protein
MHEQGTIGSFRSFVVPNQQSLDSKTMQFGDFQPGLLHIMLGLVSSMQANTGPKPMKICFDGKNINASIYAKHGDIDLFGCEGSPTL